MIRKLREALVGGEKNKENLFYFAAFILLIPSLFFLFDFKKDKFSYAEINGTKLDRRDLSLRFYDHIYFMKSLSSMFGEKGALSIRTYLLGNLSDEEYVINNELKNSGLISLFNDSFSDLSFCKELLKKNIKKLGQIEKESGLFSEICTFGLSGKKEILSVLQKQGILLENITKYSCNLFANKFVKLALYLPISLNNVYENEDINFIKATKYVYKKKEYKDKFINLKVSDDRLLSFYEERIEAGKYLSPVDLKYNSYSVLKEDFSKENIEEDFFNAISSVENDIEKISLGVSLLKEKYKDFKEDFQLIKFDLEKNDFIETSGEISLDILKLNKNFDFNYICLEANNRIYFLFLKEL